MSSLPSWQHHLRQARWFGGKGCEAHLSRISPLPWYTREGDWPAIRSELAEVVYSGRGAETYHLIVSYLPAGTAPPDLAIARTSLAELGEVDYLEALSHPASAAALVRALRRRAGPPMRWFDSSAVDAGDGVRLLDAEQSNTTIAVGPTALLKVFRRLERGRSPEVEMLLALGRTPITPDLYGVLRQQGYDLAMFCQRIPEVTDGWAFATTACATGRDISAECRSLGAALRTLHTLLADAFGTSTQPGDALAGRLQQRFDQAAAEVTELDNYREPVRRAYLALTGKHWSVQRVHGDFHLGQALHRSGWVEPWTIIDFEGEPGRPLAQRRSFDPAVRDVAGLLRSLDYARGVRADPQAARAHTWVADSRAAFIAGYGCDEAADRALLRAYELDKAIYEVVYETNNRPKWAHIPWRAVQDEARRVSQSSQTPTRKEQ